jgi:hypothetical protein
MFYGNVYELAILLFFLGVLGPTWNDHASHRGGGGTVKGVEVSLRLLSQRSDKWEIEIETRNNSSEAIYVLTDPRQSTGDSGPYVDVAGNNNQTLHLSVKFFEGPRYFLYVNATKVSLKRLEPNASYAEKYILRIPLRSTTPPYGNSLGERGTLIDQNKINTIEATIGVLPDDEGVRRIAQRQTLKQFPGASKEGDCDGNEPLTEGSFKGKPLREAQTLINTFHKLSSS